MDLRRHGEKTVLVKKVSSTVSVHLEKGFKIEVMACPCGIGIPQLKRVGGGAAALWGYQCN